MEVIAHLSLSTQITEEAYKSLGGRSMIAKMLLIDTALNSYTPQRKFKLLLK
jgi:hypothetical protein